MGTSSHAQSIVNAMEKLASINIDNNAITALHRIAYITSLADADGRFTVMYQNQTYRVPARDNLSLAINDIVILTCFNGDINKSYIDIKKTWTCW